MNHLAYWLAVYRGTRLLQRDTVPPLPAVRDALMTRYGSTPASELLDCPWCLSPYVAVLLALLRLACPRLGDALITVLAASAVTGLATEALDVVTALADESS